MSRNATWHPPNQSHNLLIKQNDESKSALLFLIVDGSDSTATSDNHKCEVLTASRIFVLIFTRAFSVDGIVDGYFEQARLYGFWSS